MNVTLIIAGTRYDGWERATVTRSLNSLASSFELTVSDRFMRSASNIPLDQSCQILLDGAPVINGYLDEIRPSYNAQSHTVTFAGRSKTCDLVDCAAVIQTGQVLSGTPQSILSKILAPFNVNLRFSGDATTIPDFQIQPGETGQAVIERLCKQTGLVYTDNASGELVVQKIGKEPAAGTLIHLLNSKENNNVLRASGTYSSRDCYKDYYVRSQLSGSDTSGGEAITAVEGCASDGSISRYRPLILIGESAMDKVAATKRANWEKAYRIAKGMTVNYTVQGWVNASGALWAPNSFVTISDDFIHLKGSLIIAGVSFEISESGSTTTLSIAPPEAYEMSEMTGPVKTYQGWKELREGV